ncbi:hypothetical protein BDR26DRAFT_1012597 [Obelidium mucronatum]|nr:hypothetical protein BDR26DRAFT_1012597 [Obelidium mucronatum]
MQSPPLPAIRVNNDPDILSIKFSFDEIKSGSWKEAPYKAKDNKKTIWILWSDLREVTSKLLPDLHQKVIYTKGSPDELVKEACEALEKMLRYINSNQTLKLAFFEKTKCTVHIPGLQHKTLQDVFKWIKDTNQDLTALEDLCFSGILDLDGKRSENDEERAMALAKYIYARKNSNNKFHVVFAPTPADTNATKITNKATVHATRQASASVVDTEQDIPSISKLPGSASENKHTRVFKNEELGEVHQRKKRHMEEIEVEDDEKPQDEKKAELHPKKKQLVITFLGSVVEEEEKKMVSVKCMFQNHGAVFRCNVEGTVAEGNKAKVLLADVLAAAKVHPATTHFRRSVNSVSWFTRNEYIFDNTVLVDVIFNPQSPEYFDVAHTNSGTNFDPFASSPLVNSPVTMYEKPGSISSKQRRQVPTSVAEVVAKAKGRTGTQDKFNSQVKEVGIRFSYLTQDREPPMTKTLAAATLSKEFPNFGNTVEIFRAYAGVFFADLEFQRLFPKTYKSYFDKEDFIFSYSNVGKHMSKFNARLIPKHQIYSWNTPVFQDVEKYFQGYQDGVLGNSWKRQPVQKKPQ